MPDFTHEILTFQLSFDSDYIEHPVVKLSEKFCICVCPFQKKVTF